MSSTPLTRIATVFVGSAMLLTLGGATVPGEDAAVTALEPTDAVRVEYAWPRAVPYPADNIHTPAREALGKALFFDPRLSGSQWISCATCHNPALGWEDGLPTAIGHGMEVLGRKTPTILNLAWAPQLFWDGRAYSLEEQALGPIEAAGEMNLPLDQMVARVAAISGYQDMFEAAYPGEGVSEATVGKAIATYERTIVSGTAPFDRWVGGDRNAVSDAAKRGFALFTGRANCAACHSGPRFTDDSFHDIGVVGDDMGRADLIPGVPILEYAFKTPTLRNIAQRAPYMHNGSEATLADVIDLYALGGREHRPSLSNEMRPFDASDRDRADLVAFLESLTSRDAPVVLPVLPVNN